MKSKYELAIAISNTIHYIHKSNVKLHELEVYSEHVASSYILIYKSLSAFSYSLVSYLAIHVLYSLFLQKVVIC